MSSTRRIHVRPFDASHPALVAELLGSASPEYTRFFHPFEFEARAIAELLAEAVQDQFFVVEIEEDGRARAAGFYMLRGLDKGFAEPMYGVFIAEEFGGSGLARLTLAHAEAQCRVNGWKSLLLKVDPENTTALNIYESLGFKFVRRDPDHGNHVLSKPLSRLRPIFQAVRDLFGVRRPSEPRFASMARRFRERIAQWPVAQHYDPAGPVVGIVLTTWLKTAVPFFSLECAFMLRLAGCRIRVYWDPSELLGNATSAGEIKAVAAVIATLPADFEVVDVAALPAVQPSHDARLGARIIRENAIWRMRGERDVQQFYQERPEMDAAVEAHLAKVFHLLRTSAPDWLLIPGGIYGVSSAYLAAAREYGVGATSYDSGTGLLLLAHTGLAAHHADTPIALGMLEKGDPREYEYAFQEGALELRKRTEGRDDFGVQVGAASGKPAGNSNVLVALNVRWDSAALARLRVFDSVEHWLLSLLDWAKRTPDARICVRQHPAERHAHVGSRDDIASLLARHSEIGDRLTFVAGSDPVSTYDLIRTAKVVLPFTSSVAMDAAMLDRPVVLGTETHYESLPFVWRAETPAEYFALIERALAGELIVTDAAKRAATVAYYLTQRCGFVKTRFTPAPDDFDQWVTTTPQQLWAEPVQQDLREALLDRKPIGFVQHRRFFRDAQPQ